MYLLDAESNGPAPVVSPLEGPSQLQHSLNYKSSTLPFGQGLPLPAICGPTYVTAQVLVQQVAYVLSGRLWAYSPETFDLDIAAKSWHDEGKVNAHGYPTNVESLQIRPGAAAISLGYIFSSDFDYENKHIPQTILASSSGLQYLRPVLRQLSLLHSRASPFVAHIAAVDYAGGSSPALVTDYVSAMSLAEEVGLGVLLSFTPHESQHMSILATLLANVTPTLHLYDGVNVGRETTRVVDVVDRAGLCNIYQNILEQLPRNSTKNFCLDTQVLKLLQIFNGELGTDYGFFEYHGHATPDSVLIVFGTAESSMAKQVVLSLKRDGEKVGVICVRIYKPFVEDEFIKSLPKSVKTVGVLGQVQDQQAASDVGVFSSLYGDVVAALALSVDSVRPAAVLDVKYPREQAWTPVTIAAAFQLLSPKPVLCQENGSELRNGISLQLLDPAATQQFSFWDLDEHPSVMASISFGQALSRDSSSNISIRHRHNSLLQGGIQRTDIRMSKITIDAPYSIDAADAIYIGHDVITKNIDVLGGLKTGGKVLLRLPSTKDEQLEKNLSSTFRRTFHSKQAQLFVLDHEASGLTPDDATDLCHIVQLAFLRIASPFLETIGISKLASIYESFSHLPSLAEKLNKCLRQVEVPDSWATTEDDKDPRTLPTDISVNSFNSNDRIEQQPLTVLKNWQTIAKGLIFNEAFGTQLALRPDLSVKTYNVYVQENRRLTPPTYERNIFHIEFGLGESGLSYEIGEALGIHAENDEKEVQEFIRYYKLQPEDVVEVPSREDSNVFENRTIYQALMQNVDIFGRPPKGFYQALAEFATTASEKKELLTLGSLEGATEFKRRAEVDTISYADILLEFPSAHLSFHDIVRIVSPMKRREYSIASCQKVTPKSVALMVVTVNWFDPKGRNRFGQATRYLNKLRPGARVTVSVKPSVMKLPPKSTQPLIMAGLGTGLAPFRAFVQHRAWEKAQGHEIGSVLLYMGSRHQREEYCYGEEWEAYQDAGVITLLGRAFSRDQPRKIYIQDRMRETLNDIIQAYFKEDGAFYLCGPTWPVPDVTGVLEDAVKRNAQRLGSKVDSRKEIEKLKDAGRFVLEVY